MNIAEVNFLRNTFQRLQSNIAAVLFLTLLPLAMFASDHSWIFTNAGWLDPWNNIGYAYTFTDTDYGGWYKSGYYKISRIPWLYIQYVARNLFDPITVSFVIQYSCLCVMAIAVYFTLRRLIGFIPALIGGSILCIYPECLASGGPDYQNTFAGPLYALCLLTLTFAAQSSKNTTGWLFVFGCLYATLLHTVVLYVNFAPIIFFYFYGIRKIYCSNIIIRYNYILYSFLGVIISTLLWGFLSYAYGYKFLFFLSQGGIIKNFLVGDWVVSPWWRSWSSGWIWNASWMGSLSVAMLFSSAVSIYLLKNRTRSLTEKMSLILNLQFVFLGLIWLFWQILKKDTLNTQYFAYPLFIPFVLSIAGNFSLFISNRTTNLYLPLILATTALFLYFYKFSIFQWLHFSLFTISFSIFFLSLLLIRVFPLASVICFALACNLSWCSHERASRVRDTYEAIVTASRWIYSNYSKAKQIYVWFDEETGRQSQFPLTNIAYSLSAAALLSHVNPPFPMPSIAKLDMEYIKKDWSRNKSKVLVLISEDKTHIEQICDRMKEIGIDLQLENQIVVSINLVRIPITILKG